MGTNARASVCYGLPLEAEVELPWGDDFNGWMLTEVFKFNKVNPWVGVKKGEAPDQGELDAYYQEVKELTSRFPATIEYVGHYNNPEFILVLPGTLQTTEWVTEPLCPTSLVGTHENTDKLNAFTEFCDKYIPEELRVGKPTFYLFPFYG